MGGLSESTSTGDLPTNPPSICCRTALPAAPTKAGRWPENIYDIAPGAGLAFATAGAATWPLANNILALATTAKANFIVDDISYPDEPFFQHGMITQAINHV